MNIQSNLREIKFSRRTQVLTIVGLLVLGICVFAISWFGIPGRDYAQEVAKPIEQSLIKAGAVKKCSTGDDGRGWDNKEPWYSAVYVITTDIPSAKKSIEEAANSAGYDLSSFSENSKYWEADIIARHSVLGYEKDSVQGGFSINKNTHYSEVLDKEFCTQNGGQGLAADGTTTFSLGIRLPNVR